MFAILQLLRSCAFALVAPVHPAAAMALGAHVISKWMPYYVYRDQPAGKWPEMPVHLVRLLIFFLLTVIVMTIETDADLFNMTAAALTLWMIVRARRDLMAFYQGAGAVNQRVPDK